MTVRSYVEGLVYDFLRRYGERIEREGKEARFLGVPGFHDPSRFVCGVYVSSMMALYVADRRAGDPRADRSLAWVRQAIRILQEDGELHTWGKLHLLRGCMRMHAEGLLSELSEKELDVLCQMSDYRDFYTPETSTLRSGYPSNYLQVAMACAGIREKLGWESETNSLAIRDQLLSLMQTFSASGWMDEQPPYGRFDRYSFLIASELADSMRLIGAEVPAFALANLRDATTLCLSMANEAGDGISYGRSLSVHGDCGCMEVFSSAAVLGLLREEEIPLVLGYSGAILRKTMEFWYDRQRDSFNLWLDGRTTNAYRGIARVLEVDLDMSMHLLSTLDNFAEAGLADTELPALPARAPVWTAKRFDFVSGDAVRCLYVLHRGDRMMQLPLIGPGGHYRAAAYLPFPASSRFLEAPCETPLPFLVPLYTMADGSKAMPEQFIRAVTEEREEDRITVTVEGRLALLLGKTPTETEVAFRTVYDFVGDTVRVTFETDGEPVSAEMLFAPLSSPSPVKVFGFSSERRRPNPDKPEYRTPHGAPHTVCFYRAAHPRRIGYTVKL